LWKPGTPDTDSTTWFRFLNNPIVADWDSSFHIDLKEATALAFGLSINNIPTASGPGC